MIRSLCALANNSGFKPARLNINDTIRELLLLTRADVQRHGIELQTGPHGRQYDDSRRIQVQQVLRNLIGNAIEAMSDVTDRAKVLIISSASVEPGAGRCR